MNLAPALQLYVGDLLREPSFIGLSLAAQGLWLRMLMVMHDACKPGLLVNANGMQMTCKILARIVGRPMEEIEPLLEEMETLGTFSKLEDGTIYCRRMMKPGELLSEKRSAAAKARWHRKNVCKSPMQNMQNDAPSSSSSSSNTEVSTTEHLSVFESVSEVRGSRGKEPNRAPAAAATNGPTARSRSPDTQTKHKKPNGFEKQIAALARRKGMP